MHTKNLIYLAFSVLLFAEPAFARGGPEYLFRWEILIALFLIPTVLIVSFFTNIMFLLQTFRDAKVSAAMKILTGLVIVFAWGLLLLTVPMAFETPVPLLACLFIIFIPNFVLINTWIKRRIAE